MYRDKKIKMWITLVILLSISKSTLAFDIDIDAAYGLFIFAGFFIFILICCGCCKKNQELRRSHQTNGRIYTISTQNQTIVQQDYPTSNQSYPGRGYSGYPEAPPPYPGPPIYQEHQQRIFNSNLQYPPRQPNLNSNVQYPPGYSQTYEYQTRQPAYNPNVK